MEGISHVSPGRVRASRPARTGRPPSAGLSFSLRDGSRGRSRSARCARPVKGELRGSRPDGLPVSCARDFERAVFALDASARRGRLMCSETALNRCGTGGEASAWPMRRTCAPPTACPSASACFSPHRSGAVSYRRALHPPVRLTLREPPAPPHLGVGLSRGSKKLPHRLERLDGAMRLSRFAPPPLGAVRCSSGALGNGGRLRAEGACAGYLATVSHRSESSRRASGETP